MRFEERYAHELAGMKNVDDLDIDQKTGHHIWIHPYRLLLGETEYSPVGVVFITYEGPLDHKGTLLGSSFAELHEEIYRLVYKHADITGPVTNVVGTIDNTLVYMKIISMIEDYEERVLGQ